MNENGKIEKKLIPIGPREKKFNEYWLQELLISNPALLPSNEIDESWDILIPLGREVSITAGPIDNLYITPEGLLCIVETKLWRNPEAHRTVLAQVLDYAKDLSRMSFDEFIEVVEKSNLFGNKPNFWNRISRHCKDLDKIEFQNNLQKFLERGKLLLLIVGDKIRPKVVMLKETFQSTPNLEFKIGLIELQMFKTSKDKTWPILIVPQVVGKTDDFIHAVVKIVYEEKRPEIEVEAFEEEAPKTKINKRTFEKSMPQDYADIFIPIFDAWIEDGYNIYWGTTGFSVRFFWREKIKSVIDIYPDSIRLLTEKVIKKRNFPLEPYHKYREEIEKISIVRQMFTQGRGSLYYKDISPEEYKIIIKATDRLVRDLKNISERTN